MDCSTGVGDSVVGGLLISSAVGGIRLIIPDVICIGGRFVVKIFVNSF